MMTLRILIPVDEKLGAIRAANYLISLKDVLKPVVSILTVYDISLIEGHGIVEDFQEKIEKVAVEKANKIVDEFKNKFEKADIFVENSYAVKGNPGEAICMEAEKLNVDMIAISPNNQSELVYFIVGSVTHYIIHHSSVPILLVK